MGNAMLRQFKVKSEDLIEVLGDKLNDSFENNKNEIKKLNLPFSKSVTNKMAGFIARKKKVEKKKNN